MPIETIWLILQNQVTYYKAIKLNYNTYICNIRTVYIINLYEDTLFYTMRFRVGNGLNIKVADFGLAKDVYMTDYYRQQSIEKMPVKWMAPEALHDRISNEKTDVVSYGYMHEHTIRFVICFV